MPRKSKREVPASLKKARDILRANKQRVRDATRVKLGSAFGKWMELKEKTKKKTHEDVALFLLNHYNTDQEEQNKTLPYDMPHLPGTPFAGTSTAGKYVHSTPAGPVNSSDGIESSVSSIGEVSSSGLNDGSSSSVSGVDTLESDNPKTRAARKRKDTSDFAVFDTKKRRINTSFDFGSSDSSVEEDDCDPDFDPDLEMRLLLQEEHVDLEDIPEVTEEDVFLNIEAKEEFHIPKERKGVVLHEIQLPKGEFAPNIPTCAIIHQNSLELLVKFLTETPPTGRCIRKGCKENVSPIITQRGTAFVITWSCPNKHENHRWTSQPKLPNGVLMGDIMLASSCLLSGNNFTKIKLFANHMKLNCISQATYALYQSNVLLPTIDDFYVDLEKKQIEKLKGKAVIIGGDGRMDSPGFSAKFCTYTTFDLETGDLANMRIIDKRMTALKSPNMEKMGFEKCMDHIIQNGVDLKEAVTDGHTGIAVLMRTKYPDVFHSLDMWHGAKAIGSKIVKNSTLVRYKPLLPWVKSVVNQFWRAGDKCENDINKFIVIWKSVLHHAANCHDWIYHKCPHPPMDKPSNEKADWLIEGGPAHTKLGEIVMDKFLLGKLKHYTRCRSNAICETFNSLILMYAAKRYGYEYPAYKGRCQLAAIDFILHKDRPVLKTKDGKIRKHRYYSKGTSEWVVSDVKEPKSYKYIPEIQSAIVTKYCSGQVKIASRVTLAPDDPRKISHRIAPKTPPTTEELVARKVSRAARLSEGQKLYA